MARFPIGQRLRQKRSEQGLTQTALAAMADISPAYLNLIEHDKRTIGGALLGRLARSLGVAQGELSGVQEESLVQEIAELARTQDLPQLDETAAVELVARNPDWAQAMLALHRMYRAAAEQALALSDRLGQDPSLVALSHAILNQITSIRSFAEILEAFPDLPPGERQRFSANIASQSDQLGSDARAMIDLLSGTADAYQGNSPEKEVDDFIIRNRNYFPALEDGVDVLRRELDRLDERLGVAIANRLTDTHGIAIVFAPAPQADRGAMPATGQAYGMRVIVDDRLDAHEDIYFEAGDHESLIHVRRPDFDRLMARAAHADISRPH